MSCFSRRHVGPTFDRERYSEIEEEANRNFEHDQASLQSESGLGSIVLSFFKTARITAVVNRFVSGGKTLLKRLASRRTDEETSSGSVEKGRKSYIPPTETVTFPSNIAPVTTTPTTPSLQCPSHVSPLSPCTSNDSLRSNNVPTVIGNELSRVHMIEGSEFDDFGYRKGTSSKMSFSEIEKGIVGVRARLLEPLLSGKKTDENNSSLPVNPLGPPFSRNNTAEKPSTPAGQGVEEIVVEKLFLVSKPDKEDDFDDSPSPHLFKHRMPEDEPKPWVEPGTVARGSLWLEPFLTGRKRLADIPKGEIYPTSPTHVAEARFLS